MSTTETQNQRLVAGPNPIRFPALARRSELPTRSPGGLILVGPAVEQSEGLSCLLAMPTVQGIVGRAERIGSWATATAEVYELTRAASRVLRDGLHALVYLDSVGDSSHRLATDQEEFACSRLSQILAGLADQPAFVAIYCQHAGRAVLIESLQDDQAPTFTVDAPSSMYRTSGSSIFPDLPVAVVPQTQPLAEVVEVVRTFEAARA